ncbi:hypothetical protein AB8989_19740 [Yersinia hibernica]|uniref:Uncharacterized protein n=1 Tax=Yersinia hibernica TaxID=2339259 RepID=A0ABX5R3B7_9GAMM|nr:hypothetical protein [Yersinia hibernica]QAX79635.1 hypothetical protein D5F51_14330 [Yersinia hibernica]
MVRNGKVQAFLQSVQYEAINEAIMTFEEAMERLSVMGRTSIADLATFGTHVVGKDDDGNSIIQSVWSFKDASELKPEQMVAISELTAGKVGAGDGGGSVLGGSTRSGGSGRNSLSIGGGGAASYALTSQSGENGKDGAVILEY